jgi:magnesium-transporting ATPase (P-type)
MIKFSKYNTKRQKGIYNNLQKLQKIHKNWIFISTIIITLSVCGSDEVKETLVSNKNTTNRWYQTKILFILLVDFLVPFRRIMNHFRTQKRKKIETLTDERKKLKMLACLHRLGSVGTRNPVRNHDRVAYKSLTRGKPLDLACTLFCWLYCLISLDLSILFF